MEVEDQACCGCGMEYGGEHRWTARDRTVTASMDQYLHKRDSVKSGSWSIVCLGQRRQKATSDILR